MALSAPRPTTVSTRWWLTSCTTAHGHRRRTESCRVQDPGPPWTEAVTVGYGAASIPLLVVPSLVSGDDVDGTTVKWLHKIALKKKQMEEKKEAEEKEKQEKQRMK